MPSEVKRMRQLEEKDNRLKQIVTDLVLEKRRAPGYRQAKAPDACPSPTS